MTNPDVVCAVSGNEQLADKPEALRQIYANLVVADDHGRPAYRDDVVSTRVEALLDEHWNKGGRSLLIYVHGGLNNEKAVVQDPTNSYMFDKMRADGHLPLFLAWRTGGWETWWEQSSRVRGGQRFERTIWDTPVYIATDLVQGVVRAPVTYLKQMGRVFDYYDESPTHGWRLADERGRYGNRQRDQAVQDEQVTVSNNLIVHRYVDDKHPDFGDQVSYALTFPSRVITSPFTDSLGSTAWENMVRRARTTIRQTAEFDPACVREGMPIFDDLAKDPRGTGVFSKLFQTIEKWNGPKLKAAKEKARLEGKSLEEIEKTKSGLSITLIGHSMGTIILSDLIRLFPDLYYKDIVYMGAAASIGDFSRSVVPYLRRNDTTRFYNLMLHPRSEALELTAGGAVPSGSLLEWIDEMYEPPKTMLDRTLGKWRNVRMARSIVPKDVGNQIVLKVFGQGPGEPLKHGSFNDANNCFWNPGYWAVPKFRPNEKDQAAAWPDFDWTAWGRDVPRPITECTDSFYEKFGKPN